MPEKTEAEMVKQLLEDGDVLAAGELKALLSGTPPAVATPDCVFCKILAREIPAAILASDQHCIVIADRNPICKTHVLVIAQGHAKDIHQARDWQLHGCVDMARDFARKHMPNGFRLVINTGEDGGQTVGHFHIHLLGGQKLPVGGL